MFKHIHDWEERLGHADGPICLRAMRTKTNSLDLETAARLVRMRMKRISPARKRSRRVTPLGPLLAEDGPETSG